MCSWHYWGRILKIKHYVIRCYDCFARNIEYAVLILMCRLTSIGNWEVSDNVVTESLLPEIMNQILFTMSEDFHNIHFGFWSSSCHFSSPSLREYMQVDYLSLLNSWPLEEIPNCCIYRHCNNSISLMLLRRLPIMIRFGLFSFLAVKSNHSVTNMVVIKSGDPVILNWECHYLICDFRFKMF